MNLSDAPRPPYRKIADTLRAQILTGVYPPESKLPSQPELAEQFDVSRSTVKEALRILREERFIASRQGSGSYVKARTEKPVELRPHIELAFEHPYVSIDFAGYTSETLHGMLQEPLDKVRSGVFSPEAIVIRILANDASKYTGLPAEDDGHDAPQARERMARTLKRHTEALENDIAELEDFGLIKRGRVEVKVHDCAPLFKLYILNSSETFFGFYPVRKHTVTYKDDELTFYDPKGKDTTLFHFSSEDSGSLSAIYTEQARGWFESVWNTIARSYTV